MRTKILLLCYVVLMGCSKESELPEGVMPKEKMVPFLIDVYTAEGKIQNLRISRDSATAIFNVYEGRLFEMHDIDRDAYLKSMSYYYEQPKKMEDIYATVLDSLNLREQRLKEKRDIEQEEEKVAREEKRKSKEENKIKKEEKKEPR